MPRIQYHPVVFNARKYPKDVTFKDRFAPNDRKRMRDGIPLLHSNHLRYLLYRSTEQSGLHKCQATILEESSSVPTVINHLKPRGIFMYLKINTSTKYKYTFTAYW